MIAVICISALQHLWKFFPHPANVWLYPIFNAADSHKKTHAEAWVFVSPEAFEIANPEGSAALDSSAETLVEAFYTATGGRLFLLTGVERVAVGAHVQGEPLT